MPGFVGEGVGADDRLVARRRRVGDLGERPARGHDLGRVDAGGDAVTCRRGCCSAITTSSSAQLPARSPMPFTAHSTCRAPPRTAASELATAMPRSSWQWVEKITSVRPIDVLERGSGTGRRSRRASCSRPCRARSASSRRSRPRPTGIRPGSRARCGSRPRPRIRRRRQARAHKRSRSRIASSTCARSMCSLASRWIGLVPMKTWMRLPRRRRQRARRREMSPRVARASEQMIGPSTSRGDRRDRAGVARRGGGEAGLDHVDLQRRQRVRHAQLAVRQSSRSRAPARRRAGWCRRCGPVGHAALS